MKTNGHKRPHPSRGKEVLFVSKTKVPDVGFPDGFYTMEDWLDRLSIGTWQERNSKIQDTYSRRYGPGGLRAAYLPQDQEVAVIRRHDGKRLPIHVKEIEGER